MNVGENQIVLLTLPIIPYRLSKEHLRFNNYLTFILKIPKYCVRKLWFVALVLNTMTSILGATSNGPAIDKFHEKLFPNCGRLPMIAASRIINSKEASVHYPWVVMVLRYFKGIKVGRKAGLCGGTIITSR